MSKHLPQMGGEGKEAYKGNKSDMSLGQHGGEGQELAGSDMGLMKMKDEAYTGPGRNLKSEK